MHWSKKKHTSISWKTRSLVSTTKEKESYSCANTLEHQELRYRRTRCMGELSGHQPRLTLSQFFLDGVSVTNKE
jgi:hypothetical protein